MKEIIIATFLLLTHLSAYAEESKPVESKPVASKPVESKPAQSKPAQSKPVASKPAQSKPAQSKPVESKPVESKPAKSNPAQSKPAQSKPAQSKPAQSKSVSSGSDSTFGFRAVGEFGFLGVLAHKVQFSNGGTYFDYRNDGGQDVLFPVARFSVELDFNDRNTIVFLYQPLRLESQVLLQNDLIVDELTFPASTGVKLLYNFPFYRVSYLRELLPASQKYRFAIGGTLQVRNATISFESADGTRFRTNRDIGLVPALKLKGKVRLNRTFYLELEADGIYAPVSYLNGSDNEIVGAILDASLRTGMRINPSVSAFLNLRYLGGGAVGTSEDQGPGDGYVRNWLHFSTVSLGLIYEWL